MDEQKSQERGKPGPKPKQKAESEVISFRLKRKEYDALAAEARQSKTLIGDLARDKFREGETFRDVIGELQAQRDALDNLRTEITQQIASAVSAITLQSRAAMKDQAIQAAIEEGIGRGIARLLKQIYKEGETPAERKLREASEAGKGQQGQ